MGIYLLMYFDVEFLVFEILNKWLIFNMYLLIEEIIVDINSKYKLFFGFEVWYIDEK